MTKFWLTTGNFLKKHCIDNRKWRNKIIFFSSNRDPFRLDKLHVHILHILSKYGIFNHLFKCNMPIHQIKFHYIKTLYKIMAICFERDLYIWDTIKMTGCVLLHKNTFIINKNPRLKIHVSFFCTLQLEFLATIACTFKLFIKKYNLSFYTLKQVI